VQIRHTRKPGRPKKPKTTPKQELYARTFVETGDRKIAKEVSGYSTIHAAEQNKNVKYLIEEYKKKMEEKFIGRAEEMTEELYDLIKTTNSDTVKLNAIKDWLDRAGLAPVSKSEIENRKIISTENQISRDLLDRLNNLKNDKKKGGE
jgi:hypothetical protein